jgi:hypothetical protein
VVHDDRPCASLRLGTKGATIAAELPQADTPLEMAKQLVREAYSLADFLASHDEWEPVQLYRVDGPTLPDPPDDRYRKNEPPSNYTLLWEGSVSDIIPPRDTWDLNMPEEFVGRTTPREKPPPDLGSTMITVGTWEVMAFLTQDPFKGRRGVELRFDQGSGGNGSSDEDSLTFFCVALEKDEVEHALHNLTKRLGGRAGIMPARQREWNSLKLDWVRDANGDPIAGQGLSICSVDYRIQLRLPGAVRRAVVDLLNKYLPFVG